MMHEREVEDYDSEREMAFKRISERCGEKQVYGTQELLLRTVA